VSIQIAPDVVADGEIRHLLPRLLHGKELVCLTEQGEVGPEDAAQKRTPSMITWSSFST